MRDALTICPKANTYVVVGADSGCRGLCNRLLRRFVCVVVSIFGVDFDLGPGPNLVLDIDNFEIDEPAEHAITRPAQYGQQQKYCTTVTGRGCSHSMTGRRYADVGAGGPDEHLRKRKSTPPIPPIASAPSPEDSQNPTPKK